MPASDLADFIAKTKQLNWAFAGMVEEFYSRPRRAPMSHRFGQIYNRHQLGWLETDVLRYGDPPKPAIARIEKALRAVQKFRAQLIADPYQCTQQRRIESWRRSHELYGGKHWLQTREKHLAEVMRENGHG